MGLWQPASTAVTSRPCNTFPCPSTVATWSVGPWSACNATNPCKHSLGLQTRAVECTWVVSGAQAPSSTCAGTSPRPINQQACAVVGTCTCSVDSECSSPRWTCDTAASTCVCRRGWGGEACDISVLLSVPCEEGIVDVNGTCCTGFLDSVTGRCCGDGVSVDAAGRCCAGSVDACGVCGGSGVAVDVRGTCCTSALPPSGLCCLNGTVDSCGVCGGDNSCR